MNDSENIKPGLNYIRLINQFWLLDMEARFSHLEVHLFFKLLEINNRLGWKDTFKFPNSRMESEIGTRQKNLIDARQKLIDFGLILYEKGTTRDAGVYKLLSDVVTKESNQESNSEDNFPIVDQKDGQKKVIRGTLTKQGKTKQEDNITFLTPDVTKTWKTDFEIYKSELIEVYNNLISDSEFITIQEKLNPNIDIQLTLEKSVVNFWSTEAGWKNKKSSRTKEINWKSTLTNSLSQPMNKVYKQNQRNSKLAGTYKAEYVRDYTIME